MEELVQIEGYGPFVTHLTLNRPAKRNALNFALMERICEAVAVLEGNDKQRVLVLKGAGKAFCAGLDLEEVQAGASRLETAQRVARLLFTIKRTRLITIAAVHGFAVAGGAGLMSACDLAVATRNARFGYPEVRRGLVSALVITFLNLQVGDRTCRELFLTGNLIGAERALQAGLLNRIAAPEELMKAVGNLTASILQGSPQALVRTKVILDQLGSESFNEELDRELERQLSEREREEAREGVSAFLEKRPPRWAPDG